MAEQAFFTLGEAAKQVGKSKATLSTAIKSGRLSVYERTESGYRIAAAELFRVFPPNSSQNSKTEQTLTPKPEQVNTPERLVLEIELAELRAKLEAAEQRIADKDKSIEDYRRRLDQEGEERRRLTAMLTDQRPKAQRKGFRARLAGWIAGDKD